MQNCLCNSYSKLFCVILLALLLSFSLSELLSNNSLYENGHWVVTKTCLKKAVMGAYGFLGARNSLAGHHLNLSKWHGFQEVIYKDAVDIREISFNFLLAKDSYAVFIFNKNSERFFGVRISLNNILKNIYFISNNNGEFITKEELKVPSLRPGSWHRFKIVFDSDNFSLYIDKVPTGNFKVAPLKKQLIGFRGGKNEALIDNVIIHPKNSNKIIRETFDNSKDNKIFLIFIIVIGINICIALLYHIVSKDVRAKGMSRLIAFNVLAIFATFPLLTFDYFYKSTRYPKWKNFIQAMPNDFKTAEEGYWQNAGQEFILKLIKDKYANGNAQGIFRILFIGTSQTWGSGASEGSDTFVNRIERKLNELASGKHECINAGISGVDSSILIDFYMKEWIKLSPKLVVINLSNNDRDAAVFASNLKKFIQLNNSRNIKTIFVLEANSIEYKPGPLRLHKIMKKIGEENGTRVIDLHGHLIKNYDKGFLWWDRAHLTSFGQELAGNYLFEAIKDGIELHTRTIQNSTFLAGKNN